MPFTKIELSEEIFQKAERVARTLTRGDVDRLFVEIITSCVNGMRDDLIAECDRLLKNNELPDQ